MQPKIVFTDVDGTFADKGHQPLPSDVPTVARLMQAGVPLCLVSARSPEGLYPFQRTLGFTGPLVCYSGAYVLDEQGRELASKVIPAQDATDIYAYLHRELPELCVNTYGFHDWICDDRSDPRVRREEGLVHAQARETDDLMGVFGGRGVHKFLLMGEPAQIAAAEQTVGARYPQLNVVRSSEILCEIMDGTASKSAGVDCLCRHYGVSSADAVAFGDGYNDLDMLGAVGRSYAMANGVDAVKAAATDVTRWTNDESGVARTVAELFGWTDLLSR